MSLNLDPRTKIIGVGILSFVILVSQDLIIQLIVLLMSGLFAILLGVDITRTMWRFRKLGLVLLFLIVIQSVFTKGNPIVSLWGFSLATKEGLLLAANYVFRVLVIFLSGAIIGTTPMRLVIQGLVQMKLPYELALMTTVGIRFLPLLAEEMKNTSVAISLRGIDVSSLPIKMRLEMIAKLFIPIVVRSLNRARHISESLENRGFVIGGKRSSYYKLSLLWPDWVLMTVIAIGGLLLVYLDYYGFPGGLI